MEVRGDKKRWPGIRDFFTNLSEPIPLKDKISLLLKNAIKIKNQSRVIMGHAINYARMNDLNRIWKEVVSPG